MDFVLVWVSFGVGSAVGEGFPEQNESFLFILT